MGQHKPERLLRAAGGTAVAGSSSMRLCAGTLVVDQPDQVLLDYLDVRNGYAYPGYDRLETNGSAELVDGDLLAPVLIGAHVDEGRFSLLQEMLPALEAVADLPDELREQAHQAGIRAVLQKENSLEELVPLIRRVLAEEVSQD